MKVYKLTDAHGCTHNNTQWGPGITHSGTGVGPLCSNGWIHAYCHPLVAAFIHPIHVTWDNPKLWIARGDGEVVADGELKLGVHTLTTERETQLPQLPKEFMVHMAILLAKGVCKDKQWNYWAGNWVSGWDRSESAARFAAEYAARFATWYAAEYAAWSATWYAAESAAESDAWSAARSTARSTARSSTLVATLVSLAKEYNINWED